MKSQFVIHLPVAAGLDPKAHVEVDGVDITDKIDAIEITASTTAVTRVWVSYIAAGVTFTGEGHLTVSYSDDGEEE